MTRDKLIETHLPLVEELVNCYLKSTPASRHLRDDMIGAASLALVVAIDSHAGRDENVKGYAAESIRRAIHVEAQEEPAIGPTARRLSQIRGDDSEDVGKFSRCESDLTQLESPCETVRDLRDQIEAACESQFDRDVVQLRSEGCTDTEVAARLSVSQPTVMRARKRIETRFDELSLSA